MLESLCRVLFALGAASAALHAATVVNWADWTSGTAGAAGTAVGTFQFGASTVNVTYSGQTAFIITGSGTNYWTEPNAAARPYTGGDVANAPPASDIIAMSTPTSRTLTFSESVTGLYFGYVSLNGNGFVFDQDFEIVSQGQGFWGDGTAVKQVLGPGQFGLTGTSGEPHGILRFTGSFTSITWSSNADENWYGFTVGAVARTADLPTGGVPEPSTILLVGPVLLLPLVRKWRQAAAPPAGE
jgi:hypothetical protein